MNKHNWIDSDEIICSLCYMQNYTCDKTKTILPHISFNSIKMKYKNFLFLDKGNVCGSLSNHSKNHKVIWDKLHS